MRVSTALGVGAMRYRRALVKGALEAVAAGWPVVPGAWWSGPDERFVCDRPGCDVTGPHPLLPPGPREPVEGLGAWALRRTEDVVQMWRREPYAVLVPTGGTLDAIALPVDRARAVLLHLDATGLLAPALVAADRCLLLTAPGGATGTRTDPRTGTRSASPGTGLPEGVALHGRGSWVPLPPSVQGVGGPARWLVRPGRVSLPPRDDVLAVVAADLGRGRDEPGPGASAGAGAAGPAAAGGATRHVRRVRRSRTSTSAAS